MNVTSHKCSTNLKVRTITVVSLRVDTTLERPYSATPVSLFTGKSLAITFYLEHVETKEITVKLLEMIKRTFRNSTCSKAIRFRFHHAISIISMASKMAEAD